MSPRSTGLPGFSGARLRQAREALGLTAVSLAEMIGVSRQLLTFYESEERSPSPESLDRLSEKLGAPREFFFRDPPEPEGGAIFYRSLAAATNTARRKAEQRFNWLQEMVTCLEQHVELPHCDLEPHRTLADPEALTSESIEEAAESLRREWGLPDGPTENLISVVERHGVVVSKFFMEAESLDAFSKWSDRAHRAYIVLNADKDSAARLRLDVAHEIGHQVLHRGVPPSQLRRTPVLKLMEQQAFRFATAFLMPHEPFLDDVDAVTLDYLRILKHRWGVSIGAMLFRVKQLGVIDDAESQRLWRTYGMRGYRRHEPLDDEMKPERPQLLAKAVETMGGMQAFVNAAHRRIPLPLPLYSSLLGISSQASIEEMSPRIAPKDQNPSIRPGELVPFRRPDEPVE